MIIGIINLAKWLRVSRVTVHRNLKGIWFDLPRTISKRGELNNYKFNKQDVWEYFKRKFN